MTGLRERKKLATAAALSDAALQLAAEHGVGNVTVEAIAAHAGVSVRTFFNYFSAKEDAVVARHREEMTALVDQVADRPAEESIIEALRATAHAFARPRSARVQRTETLWRQVNESPELLAYRLRAWAEIERRLAEVIAERTGRELDADLYPHALAAASIAVISSVLRTAPSGQSQRELTARIDAAYDLLDHGFGA